MSISQEQIEAIGTSLFNGQVAIFCGAGISIPSGIPSASELAVRLRENYITKYGADLPSHLDNNLEQIARYCYRNNILLTVLIKNLVPWHEWLTKHPNDSHLAIADFLLCEASRPVISTNYDVLIENASNDLGKELEVALSGDELSLDPGRILKIHGCQRRKEQTLWCKEQLDDDSVSTRIESIRRELRANLNGKDLIFAGFWTDWSYLNRVLMECINQIQPGRILVIDPEGEERLATKAPELARWANQHPGGVEYIKDSADDAFNAIRKEYSKRFIFAAFHLAIRNLGDIGATSDELKTWVDSLDLTSAVDARDDIAVSGGVGVVEKRRPDAPMGSVAKFIAILINREAEYRNGLFVLPSSEALKVLNGIGFNLGRVAANYASNLSPAASPDYIVCVGSDRAPVPDEIIERGVKNGFVRPGGSKQFITGEEYLAGNSQ